MITQTKHQMRIEKFMRGAGQAVPGCPTMPSPAVRLLRARLIFEEAMETIEALGVDVMILPMQQQYDPVPLVGRIYELALNPGRPPDMVGIADGCADVSVVTIGTLSACGIQDEPLLEEVDESNLRKLGPGSSLRDDGKLLKPPDWTPPDIGKVISDQLPCLTKPAEY